MATVYVVVMDDNASDTPLATVELVTPHRQEALDRQESLREYFGMEGVEVTVTPMHLGGS